MNPVHYETLHKDTYEFLEKSSTAYLRRVFKEWKKSGPPGGVCPIDLFEELHLTFLTLVGSYFSELNKEFKEAGIVDFSGYKEPTDE